MKNSPICNFSPYGGLGQIGSNMSLFTFEDTSFIIDCGILFPHEGNFGINYLIPNFETLENVDFLFISHAHEDHIGALSHFFKKFPKIKVYLPLFAKELIQRKMDLSDFEIELILYKDQDVIQFNENVFLTPFMVNHSIPDTFGALIEDKKNDSCYFFVSDFKIDNKSKLAKFDIEALGKKSRQYTNRIVFADSTNICSSKPHSDSEEDLRKDLEEAITKTSGNVYITTFASNIYRLQIIFDLAKKSGRKVTSSGRSIINYIDTATSISYLDDHKTYRDCSTLQPGEDNLIVIVAGCQADFKSALRRISYQLDKQFKPTESDLFIFSSKAIPGNEKKISMAINEISKSGCEVLTSSESLIHASGHANKDELNQLYDCFSPTLYIPIHGESYFLRKHRDFILSRNQNAQVAILENGEELSVFSKSKFSLSSVEERLPLIVSGNKTILKKEAISGRRKLSENGSIFVSINKSSSSYSFSTIGLDLYEIDSDMIVEKTLKVFADNRDLYDTETLRIAIRRKFHQATGIKPIVVVLLT